MAKKKKKKKSDKSPYVHIDIAPEQEQFPDAQSQSAAHGGFRAQGQMGNGIVGQQRTNDPRKRGEGFDRYPSEVVSASRDGLSRQKIGKPGAAEAEESGPAPFVIPVFRKSENPQPIQGTQTMANGMYGTGQFPPIGRGVPNGNPRQNLTLIQQNLLNSHNVAQQQAHQHPMGQLMQSGMNPIAQQSAQVAQRAAEQAAAQAAAQQQAAQKAAAEAAAKQQAAQRAAAEAAAKQKVAQEAAAKQQAAQEAAARQAAMQQAVVQQPVQRQMRQNAAQASVKQNTGQFSPVGNQMSVNQAVRARGSRPHSQSQQQPSMQARPQDLGQQISQPGQSVETSMGAVPQNAQGLQFSAGMAQRHQGVQPQGTLPVKQGTMRAAAQTQQVLGPQTTHQPSIGMVARKNATVSQASGYQPSSAGTSSTPSVSQSTPMAAHAQPALGAREQYQTTPSQNAVPAASSEASSATTTTMPKQDDDSSASTVGEPLLDSKAIEDSAMFDKPPVSLEEGMRKSASGHRVRKRVIIIVAIVAVLLGGAIAGYILLSEQGVVPRISIETATVQVSPQSSSSANGSASSAASNATDPGSAPEVPAGGDLSGSVVYQYTANTASGVEYKVEETVTFQSNGDCQSSTMNMTFPDEASAKNFTDNLARDYGSSFRLDSLNGNNAVVTIDNSGLHLTRDEYENALRYSVSDLVVTK